MFFVCTFRLYFILCLEIPTWWLRIRVLFTYLIIQFDIDGCVNNHLNFLQ